MNGKVSIDTKAIMTASTEFHTHAQTMRQIWQDLQREMRAAGQWWGDDSAGQSFAQPDPKKGYPGYQPTQENLLFSSNTGNACGPSEMEQIATYLSSLGDALATWANYWKYVEDANTLKPARK